jgi:hypothetical protein
MHISGQIGHQTVAGHAKVAAGHAKVVRRAAHGTLEWLESLA